MGGSQSKNKYVVAQVDIPRYMGKWYEVAKIPQPYEPKGEYNVTATYNLNDDKTVNLLNESFLNGKKRYIEGTGYPESSMGSKLQIKFRSNPENDFSKYITDVGHYWIIRMDSEYKWSVVSDPDAKTLWILCRDKHMPESLYKSILDMIKDEFDLSKIVKTTQE